jgi:hypothetical protein
MKEKESSEVRSADEGEGGSIDASERKVSKTNAKSKSMF